MIPLPKVRFAPPLRRQGLFRRPFPFLSRPRRRRASLFAGLFAGLFIGLFIFMGLAAPANVEALTLDWTGFARAEAYFGKSPKESAYGAYHLALKPEIQLRDGLRVYGRLDLYSLEEGGPRFPAGAAFRQTGAVFFHWPALHGTKGGKETPADFPLFLNLSQFYISYETEFFRLQMGRAPLDFGLGITFSAENSPFDHWLSLGDQISLRLERAPFYLQPALVRPVLSHGKISGEEGGFGLLQGGLEGDLQGGQWRLEGFYRHQLSDKPNALEVFGGYKQNRWEARTSLTWVFQGGRQKNPAIGAALEGGFKIPVALSPRLELKTGFASENFFFHPNYNAALLLWNRHPGEGEGAKKIPEASGGGEAAETIFIEEGRINGGVYFSPRVVFSALKEERLKISPLIAARHGFQSKSFDYEIDLQASYSWEENFLLSLQGGALFLGKAGGGKRAFGILAGAAVTF